MNWSRAAIALSHMWGVVLFMLIIYRPFSSYLIILLGAGVLASQLIRDKPKLQWHGTMGLALLLAIFMIYSIGYMQHMEHPEAWPRFEKKLPFLFIPLIWWLSRLRWNDIKVLVYLWLITGIFLAGSIMFVESAVSFFQSGDWNHLFYHGFTSPIKISAIYYSWFIVIAMAWPIDDEEQPISASVHNKVKIVLAALLLMCASKLFVTLGFGILAYHWISTVQLKRIHWKHMALIILAGLLCVPVFIRTTSLFDTNIQLVTQEQYEQDTRFNGLTLRLIQVRLGFEVLHEADAWINGVGPALSKSKLDERYRSSNMYVGNPELGDKGFLAYNYHNQWMETLVGTGLVGLLILLALFVHLFLATYHHRLFASIFIVSFVFMFTESFLEREQGIVLFTFLASVILNPNNIE